MNLNHTKKKGKRHFLLILGLILGCVINNSSNATTKNVLLSQSNTVNGLEDALENLKYMEEKRQWDEMLSLLNRKYTNGMNLIKMKDRVGGCRDIGIAIRMLERYRYRHERYYAGDGGGEYELQRAHARYLTDELDRLISESSRMYC